MADEKLAVTVCTHISDTTCEVLDRLARRAGTDRAGMMRRLIHDHIRSEYQEMVGRQECFGNVSLGFLKSEEIDE